MYIVYSIVFIALITLDQVTKFLAVTNLKDASSISLISNFLSLTYVENKGAAFGILQEKKVFFVISTIILVLFLLCVLIFNKKITRYSQISLVLILSGAIGNFIDRVRLGYVIDYIDIKFGTIYDFPVFNVADCCVVVGAILLVILILFNKYEKSSELNGEN